jgi:hypothetical protein
MKECRMERVVRIAGIILCVLLAVGVAILSMRADDTMYMVYLVIASLLGVLAGLIKNVGKRS